MNSTFANAIDNITNAASVGISGYIEAWAKTKIAAQAPDPVQLNKLALTRDVNIGGTSAPMSVWLMLGAAAVAVLWVMKH